MIYSKLYPNFKFWPGKRTDENGNGASEDEFILIAAGIGGSTVLLLTIVISIFLIRRKNNTITRSNLEILQGISEDLEILFCFNIV